MMAGCAKVCAELHWLSPGWARKAQLTQQKASYAILGLGNQPTAAMHQPLLQVVVERMAAKRHWPKVEIFVRAGEPEGGSQ